MMKTKHTKHVDKILQQGKGGGGSSIVCVYLLYSSKKKRFGIKLLNNFYAQNRIVLDDNIPQQQTTYLF